MESNTSYRLSTNNSYDTATEESISMYYSFNGTQDKTLENSVSDSTVELTIEETLNTIVKMPLNVTPLKTKPAKSLQLDAFSSTPTEAKKRNKNHHKRNDFEIIQNNGTEFNDHDFKLLSDIEQVENAENIVYEKTELIETLIVDSLNEMQIETHSDNNSAKFSEETVNNVDNSIKNALNVLKDANSKIWPINNNANDLINESEDFNKSISEQELNISDIVPLKNTARYSLADKMVQEIRTLMQNTTEQVQHCGDGKENVATENKSIPNSNAEKVLSANKKISQLRKPSRLSVQVRRSVLQNDFKSNMSSLSSISSISSKSSLEKSSLCSSTTSSTAVNSRGGLAVIPEGNKLPINKRRSYLPSKRLSVLNGNKCGLNNILECQEQIPKRRQTVTSRRLSTMPLSEKLKSDLKLPKPMLKTTLNSPSRHNLRKSLISKVKSVSARSVPSNTKTDLKPLKNNTTASSLTKITASLTKPKTTIPSNKINFPREDFVCEICSRSFRVSSIFESHKKTHNPLSAKQGNKCKYCDKSFAIMKALDKHLLENCLKIPLADRKRIKLAASPQHIEEKTATEMVAMNRKVGHPQRQSILPKTNSRMSYAPASNNLMLPPSSAKVKKAAPHSGIFRTPTKIVACKQCDKTFDNVLLFAEHVLSHSSGNIAISENDE